jgi:hypothetical protein
LLQPFYASDISSTTEDSMHRNQRATNALPWNRSLAPTVRETSKKIGIQAINLARGKKTTFGKSAKPTALDLQTLTLKPKMTEP